MKVPKKLRKSVHEEKKKKECTHSAAPEEQNSIKHKAYKQPTLSKMFKGKFKQYTNFVQYHNTALQKMFFEIHN